MTVYMKMLTRMSISLPWQMFQIFLVFLLLQGGGEGSTSPRRGGGTFLFGNREGGRVSKEGTPSGAHQHWEGVAGRAKCAFCSASKMPTKLLSVSIKPTRFGSREFRLRSENS